MKKGPDFSYINENGKKVTGAAAFSHEVYTNHGGVENYNKHVAFEYLKIFVDINSHEVDQNLEVNSHRKNFRVVGK